MGQTWGSSAPEQLLILCCGCFLSQACGGCDDFLVKLHPANTSILQELDDGRICGNLHSLCWKQQWFTAGSKHSIDMSGMNVILAMLHWWFAGCPAEARRAFVAGVFDAVFWLELSSTEKLACGFNCYTEMSAFTNKTEDAIKHMVVSKMCNFPSLKIGWWVHFSCVQFSKLKKQAPVDPNFALQKGNSRVLTFMSKLMRIVFSRFLYVLSGVYVCPPGIWCPTSLRDS